MLTKEEKEKYKKLDQSNLDEAFINTCRAGNLDVVKYLLTSDELKEHADIHADDYGFVLACEYGHLELIKYLLTSNELKERTNIHTKDDCGFQSVCENGYLEVVKYLLTSDELKEHADVHAWNDSVFRWACETGRLEVVKYLIFDYNIEKTKAIIIFLDNDKDYVKQIKTLFDARDLKEDLSNSLNSGKNKSKIKL